MKYKWYYNGQKVTQKQLVQNFGKQTVDRMKKDAIEQYRYDPMTAIGWVNGVSVEIEL